MANFTQTEVIYFFSQFRFNILLDDTYITQINNLNTAIACFHKLIGAK